MDLSTTYMGLKLKNPIVASSTPLSEKLDNLKRMEDAGAAAVVMFSIFEEQVKREAQAIEVFTSYGTEQFTESLSFFPEMEHYNIGANSYIDLVAKAVESVDIPIIGSINGITNDTWIDYGKKIEQAGAKALELNVFYVPTNPAKDGQAIEKLYVDVVKGVKEAVSIPVAVKLSPFFSSMSNMAQRLDSAGADALVLFNRFYQPDFNLKTLEAEPTLHLSTPDEIRLPLLWISVLYGKIKASLGATTGVHSVNEVLKYIMAGADVTMVASAILKNGIEHISVLLRDLEMWMEEREYASISEMKGSMSQKKGDNPSVFERANYIKILKSYEPPTFSNV